METGPKPTTLQLKSKCRQRYQELQVDALNTLIGWYWTLGSGAALGMKVTSAELGQRLQTLKKVYWPRGGEFENYLKQSGQTLQDMLLRAKVELLEIKTQQKITEMARGLPGSYAQQQQTVIAELAKRAPSTTQWVARTSCRAGFVTSSCKQYKGPLAPGIPN